MKAQHLKKEEHDKVKEPDKVTVKETIRTKTLEIAEKGTLVICTHPNVDADAVISLYLLSKVFKQCDNHFCIYKPEIETAVDIYVDYTPKTTHDRCIIIDHHIENTEYKSSASMIYDIFELEKTLPHLKTLVDYADAMDTAEWVKLPYPFKHFTVGTLISALRLNDYDDATIISHIFKHLDTLETYMKTLHTSEEIAKTIKVVDIEQFKVAIVDKDLPPTVSGVLFDTYNVDFIIYSVNNNIGVIRNAKLTNPTLTKLRDYIDEDGWFFHHAGFIACRGSRKHPAQTPSKYTTEDLLSFLKIL